MRHAFVIGHHELNYVSAKYGNSNYFNRSCEPSSLSSKTDFLPPESLKHSNKGISALDSVRMMYP